MLSSRAPCAVVHALGDELRNISRQTGGPATQACAHLPAQLRLQRARTLCTSQGLCPIWWGRGRGGSCAACPAGSSSDHANGSAAARQVVPTPSSQSAPCEGAAPDSVASPYHASRLLRPAVEYHVAPAMYHPPLVSATAARLLRESSEGGLELVSEPAGERGATLRMHMRLRATRLPVREQFSAGSRSPRRPSSSSRGAHCSDPADAALRVARPPLSHTAVDAPSWAAAMRRSPGTGSCG